MKGPEVDRLLEEEGYVKDVEEPPLPKHQLQRKLWQLFEHPDTSVGARVIALISVSVIALSILTLCIETLPVFRLEKVCEVKNISNITTTICRTER